jgi:RNA polymerase sigma-70 factor (ECF subfamily)
MPENNHFRELIVRVRTGDPQAAVELVKSYEPAIRRAARIRLGDTRLQRIFDSVDISQSVFGSFFVRAALGQYELDRPEQLLNLLVDMSRKKLADHVREEQAARRDYRRLRNVDPNRLAAPRAGAYEQAAMNELLQEFRRRLSDEERWLADQRARGRGWNEIAQERGVNHEALRKQLTRAIDRVAGELELDGYSHDRI